MKEFKLFDVHPYRLPDGKIAIISKSNNSLLVFKKDDVNILMTCNEFRSTDKHFENYLKIYKGNGRGINRLKEKIKFNIKIANFRKYGLLKDRNEVTQTLTKYKKSENAKVNILGIPTKDRSKLLYKNIQGYLSNTENHDRSIRFIIVDDSLGNVKDHYSKVSRLFEGTKSNLLWIDRAIKKDYAVRLSKLSGVPDTIVEFSILGHKKCQYQLGGSRNILLLLASGHLSAQVDDDIFCQPIPIPSSSSSELEISAKQECNEYWFKEIESNEKNQNVDFFSLHESLLGNHPLELNFNKTIIKHLNQDLLNKLNQEDSRIAINYIGVYGDSGMYRHWQRLTFLDSSFHRLIKDNYTANLVTRQLVRGAIRSTISDGRFCMDGAIGLDTRFLLPPFMPVQRNQDAVYGRTLSICFGNYLKGYSPWALYHNPPKRSDAISKKEALNLGGFRTNDLMVAILQGIGKNQFSFNDNVSNMYVVGSLLKNLGNLPITEFKFELNQYCWDYLNQKLIALKNRKSIEFDAPDQWYEDVDQVIKNINKAYTTADLGIPIDLTGNSEERLLLFQELVKLYGELLIYWPQMWKAAKEANRKLGY